MIYLKKSRGGKIDNTINIDFINNGAILHEVKKTKSIEEGNLAIKILYVLFRAKRNKKYQSRNRFSIIKRNKKKIVLEDEDREVLKNVVINIENIAEQDKPP